MAHSQLEPVTERSSGEQSEERDERSEDRNTSADADRKTREAALPGGSTAQSRTLSVDDVFDILSNYRRRHTIIHLNETGSESVAIRELAASVAAHENGISVQDVTYKERKRVYTSLHQLHLKKMDDLGIIRYDRDRGMIERTETTERFGTYLDSVTTDGIAWGDVSLAVAACCVVGVVTAWAGLLPIAFGPGFVVPFAVAAVFSIVSSAHVIDTRRR